MSKDVVQLRFEGSAMDLLGGYREGARRWARRGGAAPEAVVVAAGQDTLLVTLTWGEGVDHHDFGGHMGGLLDELGLPRPQVAHGSALFDGWDELVRA